nr:hypothetical protein Itr_chr08CG07410 [Ipomoea trifida]
MMLFYCRQATKDVFDKDKYVQHPSPHFLQRQMYISIHAIIYKTTKIERLECGSQLLTDLLK